MAFNYRPRATATTVAVSFSASPGSVVVIGPPSMPTITENSTRSSSIVFASSKSSLEEANYVAPQQPHARSAFLFPALRAFPSNLDSTSPMHLQGLAERDDSPPPRLRLVTARDSINSSIMTRRMDLPSPEPSPAYPPPSPPKSTTGGGDALDSPMNRSSVIYSSDIVRQSDGEPFPDALRGNSRRLTKSTPDTKREDREALARLTRHRRLTAIASTALTQLSYQERQESDRPARRLSKARPLRYYDVADSRSSRSNRARPGLRDSSQTFGDAASVNAHPELPPSPPKPGRMSTLTPPVTAVSQSSFGTFEIVTVPNPRAVVQVSRPRPVKF